MTYGGYPGGERDVSLRILAEHGRTMTFLVADGVVPSNEERGYVLRRIIRRAVRHAFLLGAEHAVTPALVDATVGVMGRAYPDIVAQHDLVVGVVQREEERFRQTLSRGLDLLDDLLTRGDVSGDDAFFLHDTLGFPIDLTREIAGERGRGVDVDGFHAHMAEQRTRAKAAHKAAGGKGDGAGGAVPRAARRARPHRFHRAPGVRDGRGQDPRLDRHGGPACTGGRRVCSRCRARPHTVLRGGGRPGRRYRRDRNGQRRARAGDRHAVRAPRPRGAPGSRRVRRHRRGRRRHRAHRRRPARRDPAQPHRHAHPPLGVARGARRARQAGRLDGGARPVALRLQPSRGAHPRTARPGRGARQRGDHRQRAGAPLRDHEGARGVARCDRVLRRQVRRSRARAGSG